MSNVGAQSGSYPIRQIHAGMGQAVAERTILRKKADGKWEDWGDVADRVAKGNSLVGTGHIPDHANEEYEILKRHIANGNILMSGRHLQHGDEKQPTRNMEVFTNCAHTTNSFLLFYLLLNGSGVGRVYDDDLMLVNWDNAPTIRCVIAETHPDYDFSAHESVRDATHKYGTGKDTLWHRVADSREGWAKAFEIWENAAFEKIHKDKILVFDFSDVRPKGSPIGGMQNRPSSGPVPTMNAFLKAASIRGAGLEPWLQSLYIDHYLAECVLVGGARRAARMSTKYWKDKSVIQFIQIKRPVEYAEKSVDEIVALRAGMPFSPMGFLWSSNNSIGVDKEFWDLLKLTPKDKKYNSELACHARAVFEAACSASYADGTGEPGFLNVDRLTSKNEGIEKYKTGDYIGSKRYKVEEDTQLYLAKLARKVCKRKYVMNVNPCISGDAVITTSRGNILMKDIVADGSLMVLTVNEATGKQEWNIVEWSGKTKENAELIEIGLDDGKKLKLTPDHQVYTLNHGWVQAIHLTSEHKIVVDDDMVNGAVIESLRSVSNQDVYDITVENNHNFFANGICVHNCGEICLMILGAFCVIADVVPYHCNTIEEAEEAIRATTRALIRVNTMDSIFGKEVQRTNRIGIGLVGVHEFAWKFFGYGFRDLIDEAKSLDFWQTLSKLKRAVDDEAEKYSKFLGVAVPHTNTTEKPAGSTSKIFGLTEAWHLPAMREYLRYVQFRNDDPLLDVYRARGYPVKVLKTYPNTSIVGFPTAPVITQLGMNGKLVTAAEATIDEQYQWIKLGEKYWIDGVDESGQPLASNTGNQISYTAKWYPDEVTYDQYRSMIVEHQSQIKCCSLMPQTKSTSYEYLPETPVNKAEYDAIVSKITIEMREDIDKIHVDCASGACPIDFNK